MPGRRAQVQRRRIFVGCEGESERGYAVFIANVLSTVHNRVHLDPKLLRPGGGDPLALIEVADKIVRREERNREPYENKFLFLDNDKLGISSDRDQKARQLATNIGANIIWQITAHEALLLRHLQGCTTRRPTTTAVAEQQLRQQWAEYQKPMSAIQLTSRLDIDALRRASTVEPELLSFLNEIQLFDQVAPPAQ